MRFPISILQRYVLGEIVRVFTFVLIVLTVLVIFAGVVQQALERGLSLSHTLKILPFIVPSMMPFTIPAALLLTVCVVYGRIAGDNEVIAAKAAGINVLSLLWPAFFLSAGLSLFSLVLTDQVIPWAEHKIETTIVQALEEIFFEQLHANRSFVDRSKGIHITAGGVKGHTISQIMVQHAKGKRVTTLYADKAKIDIDLEHRMLIISMQNGYIDFPGGSNSLAQPRIFFRSHEEKLRWDTKAAVPKARHLPIQEIMDEIAFAEEARDSMHEVETVQCLLEMGRGRMERWSSVVSTLPREIAAADGWFYKLRTELHSRYAMACSCFFFVLLGGPFAILMAKNQALTSFLLCFGPIAGGYYPLMLGLMTQAKNGAIDPTWSMWVGNAALGVAAMYVLRQVLKH
jgi:lipopolysaccharide export system permease protein